MPNKELKRSKKPWTAKGIHTFISKTKYFLKNFEIK